MLLVESYFGIIAVETGVLGLLAILAVSAAAAAFVLVVLMLGPVSTPLDSAPGHLYFWLSPWIVEKLYDLERQSRAAQLPGADEAAAVQPV